MGARKQFQLGLGLGKPPGRVGNDDACRVKWMNATLAEYCCSSDNLPRGKVKGWYVPTEGSCQAIHDLNGSD